MNRKLKVLFKEKGSFVHSVDCDTTIKKAVGILNKYRIGSLIVLNSDGDIEGILTERDVMIKLANTDDLVGNLPVRSIMTPKEKLIIGSGEDTLEHLMNIMTDNKIRHIPIVDKDGILQGLISIRDIIRFLLRDSRRTAKDLNNFIMGNYPR
jgi:CBS domain-containing protein